MTSSPHERTAAAAATTLIDKEIDCPDTDTAEFDPFQKVLEMFESLEGALSSLGTDVKEIKQRMRLIETNLEFVRQSQISEAGRLTRLEGDCARCFGKYTPIPGVSPDAETAQDCQEEG